MYFLLSNIFLLISLCLISLKRTQLQFRKYYPFQALFLKYFKCFVGITKFSNTKAGNFSSCLHSTPNIYHVLKTELISFPQVMCQQLLIMSVPSINPNAGHYRRVWLEILSLLTAGLGSFSQGLLHRTRKKARGRETLGENRL